MTKNPNKLLNNTQFLYKAAVLDNETFHGLFDGLEIILAIWETCKPVHSICDLRSYIKKTFQLPLQESLWTSFRNDAKISLIFTLSSKVSYINRTDFLGAKTSNTELLQKGHELLLKGQRRPCRLSSM